ncbi:gibberellin 3-beta-dioxygenase 1-like [Rutidosis leptorrhynchoides]|uniref:gibberellin 3-beta-dioxygenase 1-like n=1 Tax=Rutidosis leptorrhynchoides TaxID=125765 RepID=UPI003A99DE44
MTTLSEACRDDHNSSNHITPLDFDSINEVPKSHIWSQSDHESHQIVLTQNPQYSLIPVINLNDPNALDLIGQACETWGMFQVINHGVNSKLVKKVEYEARRFFSLPTQQKRKVLRSPSGSVGYGSARMAAFYPKALWHEGYTIMGSCVDDAKTLWPHDYQSFCDAMDDYQKQMKQLAHNLMLLILHTLDVTQEELNWAASTHDSQGALQLNSYPSCPNPNQAIGLGPHTDSLLLTLLHQSNTNGLEVFIEGLGWSLVQPVEDAFVVSAGDLLHIFSNAKFPVLNHRAMVNQLKHRISVAYFYGPSVESMVAPSSRFRTPCFKSLPVKEYLQLKAKHFPNAIPFIRI